MSNFIFYEKKNDAGWLGILYNVDLVCAGLHFEERKWIHFQITSKNAAQKKKRKTLHQIW